MLAWLRGCSRDQVEGSGGLELGFGIGDGEELDGFEKLSEYNWLDKEDGKVWAARWIVSPFAKMMSTAQWSQFLGNDRRFKCWVNRVQSGHEISNEDTCREELIAQQEVDDKPVLPLVEPVLLFRGFLPRREQSGSHRNLTLRTALWSWCLEAGFGNLETY